MQTKESKELSEILILGYLKGELTVEETRELVCWVKSDGINKKRFDEYCEIWITARALSENPGYNIQEGIRKFRQKIKAVEEDPVIGIKPKLINLITRYAAIFIVATLLSAILFYNIGKSRAVKAVESNCELIVPLGSRAQFTLSDGSSVTLNAGSRLVYDNGFGIKDRIVQLEGEGYFKVAKISKKPFTVITSHLNVTALGTAFNVKAYSDDKKIETTLVEGSVKITEKNKNRAGVIILKPNQKLTFFKEAPTKTNETVSTDEKSIHNAKPLQVQKAMKTPILVTENVNVEPVISWKENKWIFEKASLAQIAIDLERKFDVKIIFESDNLKTYRFTGTILAEPIEQVLEVMSVSAPINFKIKGKVVTLSENKNAEGLSRRLYNRR